MECEFYAGAGKAQIRFTDDMFPNFGENYTGIHDLPSVQVLILQDEASYALVCADIVILMDRQPMIDLVSARLGIPREHVILHTTHVLAMPHFGAGASAEHIRARSGDTLTPEEAAVYAERENRMYAVLVQAVEEACDAALTDLRPARYGAGTCEAQINVNRVIEYQGAWVQGTNPGGTSDHTVTVLRFEDTSGDPIAVLFHCNVAPGCLENSVAADGARLLSADLAGASEAYIEQQIGGGVKAFWLTGTTGDQWQALRARIDYIDENAEQKFYDLGTEGFLMPEILGLRLGQMVVETANTIVCEKPSHPIRLLHGSFSYPGSETEWAESPVDLLIIGKDAWTAVGVELTTDFGKELKASSPFAHTLLIEFATDGGRYMAERAYYEHHSYQSEKSRFAAGAAEQFLADLRQMLQDAAAD